LSAAFTFCYFLLVSLKSARFRLRYGKASPVVVRKVVEMI
jgi:hypothetical protein